MSLLDQAKADWQDITTNSDEWGRSMTFTDSTGEITATVVGLHTKHHISIDPDGLPVNAKNAHISVSEQLFIDAEYPTRNTKLEVDFKGHKVEVKDSTGIVKKYVIREWFPDETIGVIAFILGDFKE